MRVRGYSGITWNAKTAAVFQRQRTTDQLRKDFERTSSALTEPAFRSEAREFY